MTNIYARIPDNATMKSVWVRNDSSGWNLLDGTRNGNCIRCCQMFDPGTYTLSGTGIPNRIESGELILTPGKTYSFYMTMRAEVKKEINIDVQIFTMNMYSDSPSRTILTTKKIKMLPNEEKREGITFQIPTDFLMKPYTYNFFFYSQNPSAGNVYFKDFYLTEAHSILKINQWRPSYSERNGYPKCNYNILSGTAAYSNNDLALWNCTGRGYAVGDYGYHCFKRDNSTTSENYISIKTGPILTPGKTYTLSGYLYANEYLSSAELYVCDANVKNIHSIKVNPPTTESMQRFSMTFTPTSTNGADWSKACNVRFNNNGTTTSGETATLSVGWIKLEEGSSPTAWCSSKEELNS